ncbi:SDH family Clp fold serine proteinase [Nannocystis punicea]|uniref:ATP-dependent Clp protease proteolytic subunit n=1 Tax=Nannocystis punicea TaxID=2995304 RepID=A0ABY7H3E9_9BACT|nr:ATP-dependent Clp protease proteolytic subunit [Nannocystis poenicansa]WAS93808.1 ATP-dependent Clp protease proteolytic subunit [Nannocystis poenicansa]
MSVSEIFWLFFILVTLQPALKQRLLDASRARMIGTIERQRGSRVILLVHRQETMSLLGFPLMRFIDIQDSEAVLRALDLTDPSMPIDLVLHTPGGLALAASQIARAIHRRPGKVTVFVPHYAMSGGTLIALAADAIVMSPHAVLGPVDPQIGANSAASILTVVRDKPIKDVDDQTLIWADQARKALEQIRELVRELTAADRDTETGRRLVELLSEGHFTHDYPITAGAARDLGLPVSEDMPPEFMRLMGLYPQPTRQRPAVEYIPSPYRKVDER